MTTQPPDQPESSGRSGPMAPTAPSVDPDPGWWRRQLPPSPLARRLSVQSILFAVGLGWLTILLVWVGHVTVTGAELFQSAGHWGFMSELTDPDQRGEYQGAAHIGHTAGSVWAPALFTWLAMEHGTTGWLVIAAIVMVATATMRTTSRSAERYLERTTMSAGGSR